MTPQDALDALGLGPDASWAEVRHAYRDRVRAAHPDLAGRGTRATDTTAATAILTEAYAVLEEATESGTVDLAPPPTPLPVVEHTVVAPRGDVFSLLLEAGHRVGDVSYVSPEDGFIQVLVVPDGGPRCQLVAEVRPGDDTRVAFSLVSLSSTPAPPIEGVVEQMLAAVRAELRS